MYCYIFSLVLVINKFIGIIYETKTVTFFKNRLHWTFNCMKVEYASNCKIQEKNKIYIFMVVGILSEISNSNNSENLKGSDTVNKYYAFMTLKIGTLYSKVIYTTRM